MDTEQTSGEAAPANEGEGNKTAARTYNKAQRRFVKSGRIEGKAREAQQALDGSERQELLEAEAIGKSHSAGEDAQFGSSADHDKVSARAYEIWEREGRPEGR